MKLELSSLNADAAGMKRAKEFLENLTETSTDHPAASSAQSLSKESLALFNESIGFVENSSRASYSNSLLRGNSAAGGYAQGLLHILKTESFDLSKDAEDPENEILKLDSILRAVKTFAADKEKFETPQAREILSAQLEFLEDPDLILGIKEMIHTKRVTAAWAWKEKIQEASRALEASESKLLAERAADLRDIGKSVLRSLVAGEVRMEVSQDIPKGSILFSEEITPSLVLSALRAEALGLLSEKGGKTSHASILAKAAELPFIYGIKKSQLLEFDHKHILMNADEGLLWLQWTESEAQELKEKQARQQNLRAQYEQKKNLPALTKEGAPILVSANVGSNQSLAEFSKSGADGIGLFRTEFLFLEKTKAPTEEEQTREYQKHSDLIQGRPFVVRTLDIGGDKQIPYLPQPAEENPFLGVRGLRLSLKERTLFESQLRALSRIKFAGKLSLMFPMVTEVSEFLIAKGIAEEIFRRTSLDVEYGIMIEVPSAALIAESFAKHVDFFSVGTNDLTQYTLAVDRGNTGVDELYDHFHPAVLHLIHLTARSVQRQSKKNKIWLGICGSMASDPLATPLLLGLGVTELSVNPRQVPGIKDQVRNLKLSQCEKLSAECLNLSSSQEVRKKLNEFLSTPLSKDYQI